LVAEINTGIAADLLLAHMANTSSRGTKLRQYRSWRQRRSV
jgi:hypothetical protein